MNSRPETGEERGRRLASYIKPDLGGVVPAKDYALADLTKSIDEYDRHEAQRRPWWDIFDELEGSMGVMHKLTIFHRHVCIFKRTWCFWLFKKWPFFMLGISGKCKPVKRLP